MSRWLAILAALVLVILGACESEYQWYEERCLRLGLKPNTAAFNDCIQRDRQWIEREQRQRNESQGR